MNGATIIRMTGRKRTDNSRQTGIIFGAVAIMLIVMAGIFYPYIEGRYLCVFKEIAGISCPACGATRSAVMLAHLDFRGAIAMNPLFSAAMLIMVLWGAVSLISARMGMNYEVRSSARMKGVIRTALPLALLLNWAYLILTLD